MLNCFIFYWLWQFTVLKKKPQKTTDRIVNIDKEKYEINSLHSNYDFICKEIFVVRLSKNQYKSTVICKKKQKKFIINIASIFITLTEINNETQYVPKKKRKTKKQKKQKQNTKKQDKTAPIGLALSV